MKILKIVLLILVIGVSGCCLDCENTKEEHDNALKKIRNLEAIIKNNETWLNSKEEYYSQLEKYYSKIETQHRENESSVLQARVCDYIFPLCPRDMTEPGRAIIAKYGTKFDTPKILKIQIDKIIIMLCGLPAGGIFLYGLWLFIVTPNKKAFQKANVELESIYKEASTFKSQSTEDTTKLKAELVSQNNNIKDENNQLSKQNDFLYADIQEKEVKISHLINQASGLEKDIARLKATMDATKGF